MSNDIIMFGADEGVVVPEIIRGRRPLPVNEGIADSIERAQAEAKSEGKRVSRRSLLMQHIPGDDDEAVNKRRCVERIILQRRHKLQA